MISDGRKSARSAPAHDPEAVAVLPLALPDDDEISASVGGHLGRLLVPAGKFVDRLLKLEPNWSIAFSKRSFGFFKDQDSVARGYQALREAGAPECVSFPRVRLEC